jgi:nicotinamidase-related amidase
LRRLAIRAAEADSLVLAGIATSGVVLSTLRQADVLSIAGWTASLARPAAG